MSLNRNTLLGTELRLPLPQPNLTTFHRPLLPRRTRTPHHLTRRITNQLISSPSDVNLFHTVFSQLSSLTPALGFTTALAVLYKLNSKSDEFGDWTLCTSPTPFNRFIKLRCASLLLEDSNEKLVKEDGLNVSCDTGRIPQIRVDNCTDNHAPGEQLLYQRLCISTEDGGVVSLDWPANLELRLEHGMDTTILIVPGTTDGSMDESVRSFVYECLTHGCFPIVMNPRGCARSPLTTPRLFTAADSDDICTAVKFINRARPWTTFMGVGFGYGASMLTKYLAEVGEDTPLTAATCLDNPFDLDGASNHLFVDRNLTSGLIDMLQSNKELFLGRSKGFDVEKALKAKSLKEFEEAISMVSYGFDSIEEFYVSSSTRNLIGNVKIPILFIQNNAMPSFSIPHSLIAENPFTSLLICSFQSNDRSSTGTSDVSWCRHLVVEWLTAVELGLLKGRHPLLEEADVAISPSKQMASHASSRSNTSLNSNQVDENTTHLWKKMLKKSDEYVNSNSGFDLQMSTAKDKDTTNGTITKTDDVDLNEEEAESERGKVAEATEVMMNMLDTTLPETLSKEQKLKVLAAVNQGETLMNALQGAVPEEVYGKLSGSVTTILENQKKNFSGLSRIPDGTSSLNTKMEERSVGLSSEEKETNTSELNTSLTEEASNNHPSKNDTSKSTETSTSGNSDDGRSESTGHQGGEVSHSETTSNDGQSGSDDSSKEKAVQLQDSDSSVKPDSSTKVEQSKDHISDDFSKETAAQFQDSDSGVMPDISRKMEQSEEHTSDEANLGLAGGTHVEKDNQHNDASENPTDTSTPPTTEKASVSSTDLAKENSENLKKEEPSALPAPSSNSSSFSVSQAFDALTGMDDSTQLAVNSVFSVIEDVITQLEGSRDNESAAEDDNNTSIDSEKESAAPPQQKGGDGESSLPTEIKEMSNHEQITSISRERKNEANTNPDDVQHSITSLPYRNSIYDHQDESRLYSKLKNDKLPKSDAMPALYLDYVPEEGKWKLLEQSGVHTNSADDVPSHERTLPYDAESNNEIVEPSYVILDYEGDWDPIGDFKKNGQTKGRLEIDEVTSIQLWRFVKGNVLKSLGVEVSRRMQATDMADIALVLKKELEDVANKIAWAVVHDKQHAISWDGEKLVGLVSLQDEHILEAISSAVQGTRYLKEVVPIGIVVGSSLASLRKIISINAADSVGSTEVVTDQFSDSQEGYRLQADRMTANDIPLNKVNPNDNLYSDDEEEDAYSDGEEDASSSLSRDTVMVGAVTAALGASALLVHQQNSFSDGLENFTTSSMSFNQKENDDNHQELGKLEEETSKSGDSMITSLAEKAMSVAGPVMPTMEDGGVDQERLVALLADLGQRGGILRLVGKAALLWGGIRGAMSLTGKLISFLRLAERSLFQRILGFVFMVLVLWTPVVVPLLPTLVQNWTTSNSSKYAELACIIGLYSSVMLLIVLWGERIRGYEHPLGSYGLRLTSAREIKNLLYGLIGGVMLVLLIQYTNVLLGFAYLSWPTTPLSTDALTMFKMSGKVLGFIGHGLLTTLAVALVEELLFRSWLSEEIAVDLGYNQGVILSGLAFSLSQWSLKAIPGIWLLSIGLAGVRQRCQGSLSVPIGLRAGIMASSFFLKEGGFFIYQQHKTTTYPLWVTGGGDPFLPFNSVVGLAVAFLWASILYPRNPQKVEEPNTLKENVLE